MVVCVGNFSVCCYQKSMWVTRCQCDGDDEHFVVRSRAHPRSFAKRLLGIYILVLRKTSTFFFWGEKSEEEVYTCNMYYDNLINMITRGISIRVWKGKLESQIFFPPRRVNGASVAVMFIPRLCCQFDEVWRCLWRFNSVEFLWKSWRLLNHIFTSRLIYALTNFSEKFLCLRQRTKNNIFFPEKESFFPLLPCFCAFFR